VGYRRVLRATSTVNFMLHRAKNNRYCGIAFVASTMTLGYGDTPHDAAHAAARQCRDRFSHYIESGETVSVDVYDMRGRPQGLTARGWRRDWHQVTDGMTGAPITPHSTINA
jgi:hypothetical protein